MTSNFTLTNSQTYTTVGTFTYSPHGNVLNNTKTYISLCLRGKHYSLDTGSATLNMKYWATGNDVTDHTEKYWDAFETYVYTGSTPQTYGPFNFYFNTQWTFPEPVVLDGTGNDDITFYFQFAHNVSHATTGIIVYGSNSGNDNFRRSSVIFTEVAV